MTDGRVVVTTQRRDEAARMLAGSFPALELEAASSSGPFGFQQATVTMGPLRINDLRIAGETRATGATPGVIAAGVVVSGRIEVQYPRHRLDTSRPFVRPPDSARLWMRDVHLRTVTFDVDAFRIAADRQTGGDGPRRGLLRTGPVSADADAAWRWTADRIHEAVRDESSVRNPLLAEGLFELGVRMLLKCFGEPSTPAQGSLRGAPAAVRRAIAFLEEHASGAVSVPAVAEAAGVSPRSLQALFRRHVGATPLGHLHAIRLDAARRELVAAGAPTPGLIHEIALRWGFGNSGRFARLYAERFGEKPSETLRQV